MCPSRVLRPFGIIFTVFAHLKCGFFMQVRGKKCDFVGLLLVLYIFRNFILFFCCDRLVFCVLMPWARGVGARSARELPRVVMKLVGVMMDEAIDIKESSHSSSLPISHHFDPRDSEFAHG